VKLFHIHCNITNQINGESMTITYDEFEKVDLRSGTITKAEDFPRAKKPAYKVWVDFGPEIGVKQTSAQITHHYTPETLIGRQVVGCINLGSKNIGGFTSEFLLVGFPDNEGTVCLTTVDPKVPNGRKLF
jgi:tRNA-binding protein